MKKIFVLLFTLSLLATVPAAAQFSYGLKAGANLAQKPSTEINELKDNIKGGTGWFVGPNVKYVFSAIGLGVEADVLYSQTKLDLAGQSITSQSIDIPLYLRFEFSLPLVKKFLEPFIAVGPQFGWNIGEKEISLAEVQKMGDEFLASHTEEEFLKVAKSIQNDDYATITYTSGTTADPKGVVLTHRNYTSNVEQSLTLVDINEHWRTLIILPLDHCFAHVAGFYTMMSYGASFGTVPSGTTGKEALRNIPSSIMSFKPHVMLSVPTLAKNFKKNIEGAIKRSGKTVERLYNFALKNAIAYHKEGYNRGTEFADIFRKPLMLLFDKIIFKAVREGLGGQMKFFVGGGALLDIDLQRYYYAIGIPMYQGYGLSEATPIISANSPQKHIFGSSGKIVSPMEIKILDADGVEQPFGSKGEICIKGENVMAGYWKNPKSTADTIVDGWLHTGDMGYMRDAEMLYVVGRFKSLLIAADGEKYSPEGIEENLVESSKYIDGALLHNSQDPYTIALITPNKEALKAYAKELGLDPSTKEAKVKMLELLQDEVNMYRKGGRMAGAFPERWLPAAVCVLPEPWTEQNHFLNSSMKVVRGRVEEAYKANMEFAYTPEGKNIVNDMNLASL